MVGLGLDAVEAGAVSAEEGGFVEFGEGVGFEEAVGLLVVGGELADGPVAAPHEAGGAECFKDEVEVGAEVGGLPCAVVGFGVEAAEFAVDVGGGGEAADLFAPGGAGAGFDGGLGDVVEDEGLLGEAGDELDGGGELVGGGAV